MTSPALEGDEIGRAYGAFDQLEVDVAEGEAGHSRQLAREGSQAHVFAAVPYGQNGTKCQCRNVAFTTAIE